MPTATRSKPLLGVAMVLLSAACYASLPALVKVAYEHGADTVGVLALRFGIAAPLLVGYVLLRRRGVKLRPALGALALPALVYFAQTLTFFESLARMSAVTAVLTLFSYPLMVTIGATIFLREPLTRTTAFLTGAGTVGVVLSVGVGDATAAGVVLGVCSAGLFATFFLMAKQLLASSNLDGVTLTALSYVLSGIGFPVLMLAMGGTGPRDATGWLAVWVIALVGTVAGAVLLISGLRHLAAGTASMLSAAEPPLAVALAALLLAEPVAGIQIVGMAIVALALGALGYVATRTLPAELPRGP